MSDLDADLLALAGDDSSEEEEIPQTQATRAESVGEPEASDDEVAMDESDGEAPDGDDAEPLESEKYPVEGKFKSDAERKDIMAMPEIEREQILAERAEEVIQEEQARKLKAIFSNYTKENNDKKRKASTGDRDDRKSSRQKTVVTSARSEKLAELRESRAAKSNRKSDVQRRPRVSRTPSASVDADGESEGEWDGNARSVTPEEKPITKEDFDRSKIGRLGLATTCFYPNFEEIVKGCYVRASVGPDPTDPKKTVYRLGRIEDIVERTPYAVPDVSGRHHITTQHVLMSIGKGKKEFPFMHCSEHKFEQGEVDFYLNNLSSEGLPLPKKSRFLEKNRDLHILKEYRLTQSDITYKLGRSEFYQQNYKQRERERLSKQLAEAETVGETDRMQRIQQQIDNIENNPLKLSYGTRDPSRPSNNPQKTVKNQQQRLAELNKQNALADKERIRKAYIEENRRTAQRRKAAARQVAAGTKPADADAEADSKMAQNVFSSKDDLELPHPEWSFNYVEFSNKYLGSRALRHLTYDDKGRAICAWPREMCDDEVIARMEIPITCIVPEYE